MPRILAMFLLLALVLPATAHSSSATSGEVSSLLDAVEASGCTFIRNGTPHDSAGARAHMQLKYDHVRKRVKTAEDFIELAASGSSMTGRPYLVECTGKPQRKSRDWMLERLRALRNGGS